MTEREQPPQDEYWTADLALGEARVGRETALVRLRLHRSAERYHRREGAEFVPLAAPAGVRHYVHAQPYLLEPRITLAVGVYPAPTTQDAIGEVVSATWEGMRHRALGQAQAWHYPADRLLVLWECYLLDPWRHADPTQDPLQALLWQGFERVLVERFPHADRIVTPSWENLYARPAWQAFLGGQGYAPVGHGVFGKPLRAERP